MRLFQKNFHFRYFKFTSTFPTHKINSKAESKTKTIKEILEQIKRKEQWSKLKSVTMATSGVGSSSGYAIVATERVAITEPNYFKEKILDNFCY